MQVVKVLCVALVGLTLAVAVSANVADGANEKAAVHDKCGAKGGHCEVASGCGGRKLKGLCDDNGSGAEAVCCLPGKKAQRKGLIPKQLAAKRKARAAEAKKQAKAAKAAGAAMAAQTAMAKALAKDVPAPAGKTVPPQPTAAEAAKAAKEGAAVAKAAAPQPPAAAKKAKTLKAKTLKVKKVKKSKAKGKGKKASAKKSAAKKLGMRVTKGSRGVDVAQKTTKKHWQCLKKAGWEWAVVRGFRSSNRPDPHAARSLKLAAKAGFGRRKLGVYLYPCAKCGDAKGQVDRMIRHLKNHGAHRLFSTIWIDVEGRFWPAPKPTRKQKAAALAAQRAAAVAAAKVNGNTGVVPPAPAPGAAVKKQKKSSRYGEARAFFRSLVRACRAHKRYRCGVYTSAQQWQSIMGTRPIRMAARMPLWYPQFDVTPSAATTDFEGFSGWDNAWAKQYSENQNVCGLSADVNVRA